MYTICICIRILRKLKVVGLWIWNLQLGGLTWWHYSQAPETNKPPIFSFDHNSMFIRTGLYYVSPDPLIVHSVRDLFKDQEVCTLWPKTEVHNVC